MDEIKSTVMSDGSEIVTATSPKKSKTKASSKTVNTPTVSQMFIDRYDSHWPNDLVSYVGEVLKQFDSEPMETFYDNQAKWDRLIRESIQFTVLQYCQQHIKHFRINSNDELVEGYKRYGVVEMIDLDYFTVYNTIYDIFGRNMSFFSK